MKTKLSLLVLLMFSSIMRAQITENPYVESQKTKLINVTLVTTNSLTTTVDIDLKPYFLQKALMHGWISMSSETLIQYKDPQTGKLVSEKAIMMQKWINNQSKFVDASFGTKYKLLDFGNNQVWPMFRLFFPPIPNGIDSFSIYDEVGSKGLYWKNIMIEEVSYITNYETAKQKIEEYIEKTNSVYAGEYEAIEVTWHLAFLQEDDNYVLVNTDPTQPGWSIGAIWADLKATAYPNVFVGTRYISDSTEHNIMVSFEDGIMIIKDGDDIQQYIKMKSNAKNNIESPVNWSGTGFALKGGYILTNYHVINEASTITVYGVNSDFTKGVTATVYGSDKLNDLALLKIPGSIPESFNTIPYGFKSSIADVGEDVYVLGFPLTATMGEEVKVTNGIISARTGFNGDVSQYQISAPVHPGNSGGPLFDYNGNVIGIICAKHAEAENVSYAVKTSQVRNLIESVSDLSILNTTNTLQGKSLKDQVKIVSKYVYIIKCSKQQASSGTHYHLVKKGETLSSIAHQHGTSVSALCTLNHISQSVRLLPGQILKYN